MTKFLLIRHGHSMANLERVFAGHTDAQLSPIGEKQVKRTAEYIAENYKVDKIYASDLKRAYNTGKVLGDMCGIDVIPDERLREIYAGEWENLHFDYLLETFCEDYGTWKNDIGNARCTGGESVQELSERISTELTKIAEENPDKTVAIATHATPIRCMQCLWQGMSFDEMKNIPWATNASVTEAVYENGKFRLVYLSYDEHLQDIATALPKNV